MSRKLYVGNLPYETDETAIRSLFGAYGSVDSVHVPTDKMTGRARGFAFVEMSSSEEAQAAISAVNGQQVSGRSLTGSSITLARNPNASCSSSGVITSRGCPCARIAPSRITIRLSL